MTHTQAAVAVLKASGQPMTLHELRDRINAEYQTGTTIATLYKLTSRLTKNGAFGRKPGSSGRGTKKPLVWYIKDPVMYVHEHALTERVMRWIEVESATYAELARALGATYTQIATAVEYLARRNSVAIRRHHRGNVVDLPERVAQAAQATKAITDTDTPRLTVWRPYPSTFLEN